MFKFFLLVLLTFCFLEGSFAKSENYSKSPKSKLKIVLVGTIVYADHKKSIASVNSGSYFLGESIKNKARVVKISRLKVYIKNLLNNSVEYISTGKYIKSKAVNSTDIFKSEKKEYHVDRRLLDKVTNNLSSFLNDAGTKVLKDKNGDIVGFELTYIKEGGIFDSLGLEVGDQLSVVNDIKLDSVSGVMKLVQQLKESTIINLGIKRNNVPKNIRYLVR